MRDRRRRWGNRNGSYEMSAAQAAEHSVMEVVSLTTENI